MYLGLTVASLFTLLEGREFIYLLLACPAPNTESGAPEEESGRGKRGGKCLLGNSPGSAVVPKLRTYGLPPAGGKIKSQRSETERSRRSVRGRRAQPSTLFSWSTGRRRSSFCTRRSHGKAASLGTLGMYHPPSSQGRGCPGPRGPHKGWPGADEGSAACRVGPGRLESEGARQPRSAGGFG